MEEISKVLGDEVAVEETPLFHQLMGLSKPVLARTVIERMHDHEKVNHLYADLVAESETFSKDVVKQRDQLIRNFENLAISVRAIAKMKGLALGD